MTVRQFAVAIGVIHVQLFLDERLSVPESEVVMGVMMMMVVVVVVMMVMVVVHDGGGGAPPG